MSTGTPAPRAAWSAPGWGSEGPSGGRDEIWAYCDRFSYDPGERVEVHVSTGARSYGASVVRDGAEPAVVWSHGGLRGAAHPTPDDAYAASCGWPVAFTVDIGSDWRSGFYILRLRIEDDEGRSREYEHFFVVRARAGAKSPFCLVLTTSTLIAYNDWGGANHYRGIGDDPRTDIPSPVLSTQRPLSRGFISKPVGAPRNSYLDDPPQGWRPRYPVYEWARLEQYGRHHADAFWATFERHFVVWAETNGYEIDYLTQHDLHERPERLDGHKALVIVGHDEYWSWEMRDAVDGFVDRGGNVVRLGGNYIWQVRLENGGEQQVCYKDPRLDPVRDADPTRVTTAWGWTPIGRPAAATMGLDGLGGVYIRYGNAAPRASGGFTVYRPDHWALEDSDLRYGDVFGAAPIGVAAFEVDGVDYTFRDGLPEPTRRDGAPETLEIIAMAPAVMGQEDEWNGAVPLGSPIQEVADMVEAMGDGAPEHLRGKRYGAAMLASFTRGEGTVFNAGSTDWVFGLVSRDPFTEKITKNVLDRLGSR